MNYSTRYMDIKNRPMLQMNRGMGKLDLTIKLLKIALLTTAIYISFLMLVFFVENIFYF